MYRYVVNHEKKNFRNESTIRSCYSNSPCDIMSKKNISNRFHLIEIVNNLYDRIQTICTRPNRSND